MAKDRPTKAKAAEDDNRRAVNLNEQQLREIAARVQNVADLIDLQADLVVQEKKGSIRVQGVRGLETAFEKFEVFLNSCISKTAQKKL